jgi:predicted nucleotidyltransferase
MKRMINDQNKEFILKVIEEIKKGNSLYRDIDSTWVLIGSYVINQNTEQSDIDLLFIHQNDKFNRFKGAILGKQVSVCSVPISYLRQDGEERRYGGYFSGKCLNPFEVFYENELIVNEIYKATGLFIGKLAGYIATQQNKERFCAEEITAHVFSAYISLHAGYISYFLSYFIAPNFKKYMG